MAFSDFWLIVMCYPSEYQCNTLHICADNRCWVLRCRYIVKHTSGNNHPIDGRKRTQKTHQISR